MTHEQIQLAYATAFAKFIRLKAEELGMTGGEIHRRTGLSRTYIYRMLGTEVDKFPHPSIGNAHILCDVLGVSAARVMYAIEQKINPPEEHSSLTKVRSVHEGNGVYRAEVTDLDPKGYVFEIGQEVEFVGLLDSPEFNGKRAVIRDYRPCSQSEHCPSGRAYYLVDDPLPDWVYEERLKAVPPATKNLDRPKPRIRVHAGDPVSPYAGMDAMDIVNAWSDSHE